MRPLAWALFAISLVCSAGCAPSSAGDDSDAAPSDAGPDRHVTADDDDAGATPTGPQRLSESGLYADFASRTLARGVLTFTPRQPLWSDGAEKKRYLLLPEGSKIDTSSMDDWKFPIGTKAWKEFSVDGKLVETRLLWKQRDGADGWWMAAYAWSADGSEAMLTTERVVDALGTNHDIPSQKDCIACHADTSDILAGVNAIQLSAADGNGMVTQLATAGRLTAPPAAEFQPPGTGATQAALMYLNGNCGNCHNGRGRTLAGQTPMRLNLRVTDSVAEQTLAYTTTIGIKAKHGMTSTVDTLIVSGQPDASEVWLRASARGNEWAMPPLGSKVVDPGATVVRDWIGSLQ
jgi:hypothetical protein